MQVSPGGGDQFEVDGGEDARELLNAAGGGSGGGGDSGTDGGGGGGCGGDDTADKAHDDGDGDGDGGDDTRAESLMIVRQNRRQLSTGATAKGDHSGVSDVTAATGRVKINIGGGGDGSGGSGAPCCFFAGCGEPKLAHTYAHDASHSQSTLSLFGGISAAAAASPSSSSSTSSLSPSFYLYCAAHMREWRPSYEDVTNRDSKKEAVIPTAFRTQPFVRALLQVFIGTCQTHTRKHRHKHIHTFLM
jgi:hypothetical protein